MTSQLSRPELSRSIRALTAEQAALKVKRDAEFAIWDAFLVKHGTGDCVFTRVQSLGGYAAARAKFESLAA